MKHTVTMLGKIINFFLILFVFLFSLLIQLEAQDEVWPMSRNNPQNTGQSIFNGPNETPSIIQNIMLSYIVESPLVIGKDGKIFAVSKNDTLYALDKSLNILWKKNVDVEINGWGLSHPALYGESVFIFDYNGNRLLAFATNSGELRWETENLGEYGRGIPIVGNDGTIYILFAGSVQAIAYDGNIKWSRNFSSLVNQVALSPDGATLYLFASPNLIALSASSGSDIWACPFASHSVCPHRPSVSSDGTIYATNSDSLYAISSGGSVLWTAYVGQSGNPGWTAIDELNNHVYVASANDTLYAFDFNGVKIWETVSGHYYYYEGTPITDKNGIIYLLCKDSNNGNKIKAFLPNDGTLIWTISGTNEEGGSGNQPESQPVIGKDENIYVGHSRGVYVISDAAVRIKEPISPEIPDTPFLLQNFPNPFNNSTIITYSLSHKEFVTIKILDALGKEIMIIENEIREKGIHSVTLDATSLASGVYFYTLQSDNFFETKKMILLK